MAAIATTSTIPTIPKPSRAKAEWLGQLRTLRQSELQLHREWQRSTAKLHSLPCFEQEHEGEELLSWECAKAMLEGCGDVVTAATASAGIARKDSALGQLQRKWTGLHLAQRLDVVDQRLAVLRAEEGILWRIYHSLTRSR